MPFFVASKNVINDITSTLSKSMSSLNMFRFAEKFNQEMRNYFPLYMNEHDKIINSSNISSINTSEFNQTQRFPRLIENNEENNDTFQNNLGQELDKFDKENSFTNTAIQKTNLGASFLTDEVCEDLIRKYPYIDWGCKKATSFLQITLKNKFIIYKLNFIYHFMSFFSFFSC